MDCNGIAKIIMIRWPNSNLIFSCTLKEQFSCPIQKSENQNDFKNNNLSTKNFV